MRTLPADSFSFAMASGIVSTAFRGVGRSRAVADSAGPGRRSAAASGRDDRVGFRGVPLRGPARCAQSRVVFGFSTIVAAINVVGVRLYSPASPTLTIVLAALSVPLWLLFTCGLPGNLMLPPLAGPVDGSWFLWVVGTPSLATAAATLGAGIRSHALAVIGRRS